MIGVGIGQDRVLGPNVSSKRPRVVFLKGQSNARGTGSVLELTAPFVYLASPFTQVTQIVRMAKGAAFPPSPPWIEYERAPVQPRETWTTTLRFGMELTLARALYAARPDINWVIIKATWDDTDLAVDWAPGGLISEDVRTWFLAKLATINGTVGASIWVQGENDAFDSAKSLAYGTNLANLIAADRTWIPGGSAVPFLYGRLHTDANATFKANVRAAQEGIVVTNAHMINQDTFPLRVADQIHFATTSLPGLGDAYAAKILELTP